jgi:hypothetical protein
MGRVSSCLYHRGHYARGSISLETKGETVSPFSMIISTVLENLYHLDLDNFLLNEFD